MEIRYGVVDVSTSPWLGFTTSERDLSLRRIGEADAQLV